MTSLLILLSFSCPDTQIINQTKFPWNDFDQQTLNYCKKKCKIEYSDAPCLKKFYKTDELNYFALCGEEV